MYPPNSKNDSIILLMEQLEKSNASKDKVINDLQKELKNQEDVNSKQKRNVYINKASNKESKPTLVVPFGNYTASLVDGIWIYKANETTPLAGKKFENPKYKDPVQFKVMEEYEGLSESRYREQLNEMVKGIAIFLKNL